MKTEIAIIAILLLAAVIGLCIAISKLVKSKQSLAEEVISDSSPNDAFSVYYSVPATPAQPPKKTDRAAKAVLLILGFILFGCVGGLIGWLTSTSALPLSVDADSVFLEGYNQGQEAGYDEGYDIGLNNGYDEGYGAGYNKGYSEGNTAGYHKGYDEGYDQGIKLGAHTGLVPSPTPSAYSIFEHIYPQAPSYRPANGTIFKSPLYEGLAPFEVNAPTDSDCYVYLHCLGVYGTSRDIAFYVREDMYFELLVPLGTYELYYATGDNWASATASNKMVFGSSTVWNVSDDLFYFTDEGEYYNGYTVTLYSVYNGNMDTDVIDASDLPF